MPHFSIMIMFMLIQNSLNVDVEQIEMGRFEFTVPNAFYELNNLYNGDKLKVNLTWNINQQLALAFYSGKQLIQVLSNTTKKISFADTIPSRGNYSIKIINQHSNAVWYNLIIQVNSVIWVADDRSMVGSNLQKLYKIFTVQQPCKKVKLVSSNYYKTVAIHARNPDDFNRQESIKQASYTFSAQSTPETQISFDKAGDWLFIAQIKQSLNQIKAMKRISYRIAYVVKCVVCVTDDDISQQQCQKNYIRNGLPFTKKSNNKNKSKENNNILVEISVIGVIVICSIAGFFILQKVKQRRVNTTLGVVIQNYYKDNSNNKDAHRRSEQQIQQQQTTKQNNHDQSILNKNNMRAQNKPQQQTQTKKSMQVQMQQLSLQPIIKNYNNNDNKSNNFYALQSQIMNQDKINNSKLSLLDKSQQKQ